MLIFLIWLINDYQSYIDGNVFDLSKFFYYLFYVGVDRIVPVMSVSTKSAILQEFKVVLNTRRYLCR